MATAMQQRGAVGENLIVKKCICPQCDNKRTFKKLPSNFKCADVICDFCGFVAQVKTMVTTDHTVPPRSVLGGAWGVQQKRLEAGIVIPVYLVLVSGKKKSIFFLPKKFLMTSVFVPRKPLSANAKRAGWQGFVYDFSKVHKFFVKIV